MNHIISGDGFYRNYQPSIIFLASNRPTQAEKQQLFGITVHWKQHPISPCFCFYPISHKCGFCAKQVVIETQYVWEEAFEPPEKSLTSLSLAFFSFHLVEVSPHYWRDFNRSAESCRWAAQAAAFPQACTPPPPSAPHVSPAACKSAEVTSSSPGRSRWLIDNGASRSGRQWR